MLSGDTKISGRWKSSMGQQRQYMQPGATEFKKPLSQAVSYANSVGSQYAYIITDYELVCIRRTSDNTPPDNQSIAVTRGQRSAVTRSSSRPQRVKSVSSITSATSYISLDSSVYTNTYSTDSYNDGIPDINKPPIEYVAIPWSNSGRRLTINLGLWFLHILASIDNTMQKSYVPLDRLLEAQILSHDDSSASRSADTPSGAGSTAVPA
ncbi:hypothetical protein RUND412_000796 [Rhizina undulata]